MIEVERKFLLAEEPDLAWETQTRLRQGCIALDGDTEVRIRGNVLTVKRGGGLVRAEIEVPVDDRQAEALWRLTEGRRLEQVRKTVRRGELLFEVDVYSGALAGLVVAEVEFPDARTAAAFVPPPWLGREVTGDRRYANRALAVDGLPPEDGGEEPRELHS